MSPPHEPHQGFFHYVGKVYGLHRRLKAVRDDRPQAKIPTEMVSATLFLGVLLRIGSFLQLEKESQRRGFQRLTGYGKIVHDDLLDYVCERYRVEGRLQRKEEQSHWRWVATRELDGYGAEVVWRIGHRCWGVENDAFNELTQHYHLSHCPHHHPVAILACLLIKVLVFNLFEFYVKLNGKLWRMGRTTLLEIARQMDLSMEQWEQLDPIWSG
ncbi:MAG: hypothetical protein PHV34_09365 [Verrucomicrobiae bacterium]|nr:hypothetical protein [Verrucomicrobiae bacterium]